MVLAICIGASVALYAWAPSTGDERYLHALCVAVAAAAAFGVWRQARAPDTADAAGLPNRWIFPWAALLVVIGIQSLNASHLLSPYDHGLTPKAHLAWLPRSVAGVVTRGSLLKLLLYGLCFWTVGAAVVDRRRALALIAVMLAGGLAMALLTLTQRAAHLPFPVYPLTGRFVNENSYVAYANMLLPVALGAGRSAQVRAARTGSASHPGVLLYVVAAILLLSVLVCSSRFGSAVALALVGLCGWGELRSARDPRRRRSFAVGAAVVLGAFCLATVAIPSTNQIRDRWQVCHATMRMAQDRWLFGTGAGTFAEAFPYYKPHTLEGFYRYAHNDYLQYLAELGVVGALLLAATVAAGAGRGAWTVFARSSRSGPLHTRERRGIALALGGVAVHAGVDFPLHIPAIAMLACVWLGLLRASQERHVAVP
jgi:O-antigen ligase